MLILNMIQYIYNIDLVNLYYYAKNKIYKY